PLGGRGWFFLSTHAGRNWPRVDASQDTDFTKGKKSPEPIILNALMRKMPVRALTCLSSGSRRCHKSQPSIHLQCAGRTTRDGLLVVRFTFSATQDSACVYAQCNLFYLEHCS